MGPIGKKILKYQPMSQNQAEYQPRCPARCFCVHCALDRAGPKKANYSFSNGSYSPPILLYFKSISFDFFGCVRNYTASNFFPLFSCIGNFSTRSRYGVTQGHIFLQFWLAKSRLLVTIKQLLDGRFSFCLQLCDQCDMCCLRPLNYNVLLIKNFITFSFP